MLGLGFIVVDCKCTECSEVVRGDFRWLNWLSGEGFLYFYLDNCRDGNDFTWLRFAPFAGFGIVVLCRRVLVARLLLATGCRLLLDTGCVVVVVDSSG